MKNIDDNGILSNGNIIFPKIAEIILRARARARANQAESVDSNHTKEVKAKRAAER